MVNQRLGSQRKLVGQFVLETVFKYFMWVAVKMLDDKKKIENYPGYLEQKKT